MSFLLLALVLAAGYSAGTALLSLGERRLFDGWARKLLFRLGVGLAALAYALLALGQVGLVRPGAAWALLVVASAVGAPTLLHEARERRRMEARQAETPVRFTRVSYSPHVVEGEAWARWWPWVIGVVVALLAVAAAVRCLTPPVAYDELTYHLAAPKVYARTGYVTVLPYDHHTAFPFTLEMLYTLALLLGNAALAKLIHLVFWLLTLLALGVLGRDLLGPRVGWLAVLVYAATPLAWYEAGTAYNEFGYALYQLLAWLAFAEYLNLRVTAVGGTGGDDLTPAARQPAWAVITGVMAGLAYGTKYTGVLVAGYLLLSLVILGRRDRLTSRAVRVDALKLALAAALVASPWVWRTWVATGNPVFPFADGLFHSRLWSTDRAAAYDASQKEFGRSFVVRDGAVVSTEPTSNSHRSPLRLLTAPWHLTFEPDWFYDKGLNFDGKARLGPAWLAFVLPALVYAVMLARRRGRGPWPPSYEEVRDETTEQVHSPEHGRQVPVSRARAITERITVDTHRVVGLLFGHLLVNGLIWFVTMQYSRYLVPQFALWALLAAWGADGLLRLPLGAVAALVVLVMQAVGGLAYAKVAAYPAMQVVLGGRSSESYVASSLGAYPAMAWINADTPPQSKVILYGEPRGYWLDRDYLWGERGHSTVIPDSARASMPAFVDFLRDRLHVTHALVWEPTFTTDRTEGNDDVALVTQAIRAGRFRLVYADERRPVRVYAVR